MMEEHSSKEAQKYEFKATGAERFAHMLWCISSFDEYVITGHQSGHLIYWKLYYDSSKNQTRFEQCQNIQAHKQGVRWLLDFKLDAQLKSSNNLNNSQIFPELSSFRSLLVTGSWDQSIGFWDNRGNLIHREDQAHSVRIVCLASWNGQLISADVVGNINLWKIELASVAPNLSQSSNTPPPSSSLVRISLVSSIRAHEDIITSLLPTSFGNLWTSCSERSHVPCPNIKVWNPNLELLASIDAIVSVNCLCEWNGRIASASDDGSIQIHNPQGTRLFELGRHNTSVAFLCVYKQLLCSSSIRDNAIKMWTIYGECLVQIKQNQSKIATQTMLMVGPRLLVALDKGVAVWKGNIPWKVVRTLWIGWKKNNPSECELAHLPKEIIRHILVFANAH